MCMDTQGENSIHNLPHIADFRMKERITIYTRVGKMDLTNVKILSVVDESFGTK